MSEWIWSELGICREAKGLSRNLFTSGKRGDDLNAVRVPNRNRVHRTGIARAQQLLPLGCLELDKYRRSGVIEHERRRGFRHAITKADAQRAIDAHAQLADRSFVEVSPVPRAHMPSSPNSTRALSMMAGVISVMPRLSA